MSKTTEVWTSVSSQLITAMFVTVDMWKEIHSFIFIHSFNLSIQVRIVEDPGNTEKTQEISPQMELLAGHIEHTHLHLGGNVARFTLCVGIHMFSLGSPVSSHTE